MRILKLWAPKGTIFCLFYLWVGLVFLLGTSALPTYIPSSKHRHTSGSRQGGSGSSIPYHPKGRPLKQYKAHAFIVKENLSKPTENARAAMSDQQPSRVSHQRRQSEPGASSSGLPSASFNRKRDNSHPFDRFAPPAAARPS